jgi:hypothetical protein
MPEWAAKLEAFAADRSLDNMRRQLMGKRGPLSATATLDERVLALVRLHEDIARVSLIDWGSIRYRGQYRPRGKPRRAGPKRDKAKAIARLVLFILDGIYGKPLRGPSRSITRSVTGIELSLDEIDTLLRHFFQAPPHRLSK